MNKTVIFWSHSLDGDDNVYTWHRLQGSNDYDRKALEVRQDICKCTLGATLENKVWVHTFGMKLIK